MVEEVSVVCVMSRSKRSQRLHVFHFLFVLVDIVCLGCGKLIREVVVLSVDWANWDAHVGLISIIFDLWPILGVAGFRLRRAFRFRSAQGVCGLAHRLLLLLLLDRVGQICVQIVQEDVLGIIYEPIGSPSESACCLYPVPTAI